MFVACEFMVPVLWYVYMSCVELLICMLSLELYFSGLGVEILSELRLRLLDTQLKVQVLILCRYVMHME